MTYQEFIGSDLKRRRLASYFFPFHSNLWVSIGTGHVVCRPGPISIVLSQIVHTMVWLLFRRKESSMIFWHRYVLLQVYAFVLVLLWIYSRTLIVCITRRKDKISLSSMEALLRLFVWSAVVNGTILFLLFLKSYSLQGSLGDSGWARTSESRLGCILHSEEDCLFSVYFFTISWLFVTFLQTGWWCRNYWEACWIVNWWL